VFVILVLLEELVSDSVCVGLKPRSRRFTYSGWSLTRFLKLWEEANEALPFRDFATFMNHGSRLIAAVPAPARLQRPEKGGEAIAVQSAYLGRIELPNYRLPKIT